MGIAVITIFCNESFRIPKWIEYYNLYKEEIDLHIVVNNGSKEGETEKLRGAFPDAILINLDVNGGVAAAYNAGIKYIIKNTDIDAVAFVGNDIKIEKGGLTELYKFLMENNSLGEVSPILLKRDSMIIEDNGDYFTKNLVMNEYDRGKVLSDDIQSHISDGLPGAINMAKIQMYKDIGLLDETLFMYSDEVDIGLRAMRYGYEFSSCAWVKAWHQHENFKNKATRDPWTNYLVIRNKVYLARKYFGLGRMLYVFVNHVFYSMLMIGIGLVKLDKEKRKKGRWQIIGACNGLIGNMKSNRFSQPGNKFD